MKLIVFGATGMVGSGVLREALADPAVEQVLVVGRHPCGVSHPKLVERLTPDLFDVSSIEAHWSDWDAAIWAIGVSSVGMTEAAYARVTEELTLIWARALLRLNPSISFCYCSGAGADGSAMWAKVRHRLEEALLAMPYRHVGIVRPGAIAPGPGIRSRVKLYQAFLSVFGPLLPLVVRLAPGIATNSERLGRAMIRVVRGESDRPVLESADINRLGA